MFALMYPCADQRTICRSPFSPSISGVPPPNSNHRGWHPYGLSRLREHSVCVEIHSKLLVTVATLLDFRTLEFIPYIWLLFNPISLYLFEFHSKLVLSLGQPLGSWKLTKWTAETVASVGIAKPDNMQSSSRKTNRKTLNCQLKIA